MMHPRQSRDLGAAAAVAGLALFVCACLLATSGASGDGLPRGLALKGELGCGYDSNIFRQSDTTSAQAAAGSFIPYLMKLSYQARPARGSKVRAVFEAAGQFYFAPNDNGGFKDNLAVLYYDKRISGWSEDSLSYPLSHAEARVFWVDKHQAYVSRATGEEISEHKDRLNWDEIGGAVRIWARWPRPTRWDAEVRAYWRDYEKAGDIYPLDHDSRQLRLGLQQDLGAVVSWQLEYTRSTSDYTSYPARDFDGNQVPGSTQKLVYEAFRTGLVARFAYAPYFKVTLTSSVEYRTRDDLSRINDLETHYYFHYLDYEEWSIRPEIELATFDRIDLDARFLYLNRHYAKARVDYIPFHPLRHDEFGDWVVRFRFHTSPSAAVYAQVARDDNDEANPRYAYVRTRSSVGYSFSF